MNNPIADLLFPFLVAAVIWLLIGSIVKEGIKEYIYECIG
tara:strand:- start:824 stop:943 length:120 start_codon:yes stop_codon:yes gene_type:complete